MVPPSNPYQAFGEGRGHFETPCPVLRSIDQVPRWNTTLDALATLRGNHWLVALGAAKLRDDLTPPESDHDWRAAQVDVDWEAADRLPDDAVALCAVDSRKDQP